MDPALHEEPGPRRADLPLVVENPKDGSPRRGLLIRVREDDVRGLSPELQRHLLQRARGVLHDQPPRGRFSREGYAAHARMRDEGAPRRGPEPRHDVQHAGRNARLERELSEAERRERRLLGGFENHRIPRSQRRRDLARCEKQRKIPRNDEPHDAERLPHRVVQVGTADRDRVAFELGCGAGEVIEDVDRKRDVDLGGLPDRFSRVQGLELGKVGGFRVDEVAQLPEQAPALRGGHLAPRALEGPARRLDREVDVGSISLRDLEERVPCRGIERLEALPGLRLAPIASDQHAAA